MFCPAKGCYVSAPISTQDGPAIKMTREDHALTSSHGSSSAAKAYRAKQQQLLSEGKLKEAIQMDVDDIRLKFGNKYDSGIEQMLKYADTLDPKDFIKSEINDS